MANAKNYAGSFAQGFIDAYLRARQIGMYSQFFKARMDYMNYIMRASTFDPTTRMFFDAKTGKFSSPVYIGPGGKQPEDTGGMGAYQSGYEGYKKPTISGDEQSQSKGVEDPEIRARIIKKSQELGKDPAQALNIWRAESGGGKNLVGDGGSSFGDFQAHVGGLNPSMPHPGVGDEFRKATGLDPADPNNRMALLDYSLSHADKYGWHDWSTAKKLGYDKWNDLPGTPQASAQQSSAQQSFQPYQVAGAMQPPPSGAIPTPGVSSTPPATAPPATTPPATPGVSSTPPATAPPATTPPATTPPAIPGVSSTPPATAPPATNSQGLPTGHYEPSTGNVRGPGTWMPDTPNNLLPPPQWTASNPPPTPPPRPPVQGPPQNTPQVTPLDPNTVAPDVINPNTTPVLPPAVQTMEAQADTGGETYMQDGGEVDPSQQASNQLVPQQQSPVVSSSQSVNDITSQIQQGAAMMGNAVKQEGATGPDARAQQMHNMLQPQGAVGAQMNQLRYQIANWPSIFSYGASSASPVPTTSTAYQSGGSVDGDTQPEQVLQDATYDEAAGYTPDVTSGVQSGPPQGVQEASMLSMPHTSMPMQQLRMPHMGGGMPRLGGGMGGGGSGYIPRGPSPKSMAGPRSRLPESYTGEDAGAGPSQQQMPIPSGTPQMMDNDGNPSRGFTDALVGGMRQLMNMLGGNQAVPNDPMSQYRLTNPSDPVIADGYKHAHEINKTVDSDNVLDDEMRHIAGMESAKEYWDMQGHPEIGDKIAAGMLLHARDVAMKHGDEAMKYLYGGNYDKAVEKTVEAYNNTPDGMRLTAEKVGEGQYSVEQRNLRNKVMWQQVVGPRQILAAAAGAQSGIGFWHMMAVRAAPYDLQSKMDLQQEQQSRAAQSAWEPTPVGGEGPAASPTPRVTPASAIPPQGRAPVTQQPQVGRGDATPPSSAPPTTTPPQTNVTPAPAAQAPPSAAPQPGPPVAQPASMLQQRGLQPPQLQEPDMTADQQRIEQKYFGNLTRPTPTGYPAQDRMNDQRYNAEVAQRRQLANQELSAIKTDKAANARVQFQQQGEMFALKKASAAAKERQIEADQSEARKVQTRAQAPMEDKDLNDTMTTFDSKNVPPRMVSAVRATQRFNKGMDPNDVADIIKGISSNQYRLDETVKPQIINDEHGPRMKFGFVRSDGSRGHITMPEDEFDNMMTQKKAAQTAATPTAQAAGPSYPASNILPTVPSQPYRGPGYIAPRPGSQPAIPWVPNSQVPEQWKQQFPELRQ
jgi:hypothetical protein